jgi:hypothetical protein
MKTKNILQRWVCAAMLILSANACGDYLDINTNPNNLPNALIQNVLPGAQIGVAFNVGNTIQITSSLWVQHQAGTGTQTQPYDIYNVVPNDFLNDWNSLYASVLDDLGYVVEVAKKDGNHTHAGIAKILMAYTYAVTTDMWGDVPYSEALRINEFLKPSYDPQAAIYDNLLLLIDDGKADLLAGSVLAASQGDVIYAGDINKWERAANSIKLKLLLQMRKQNPAKAKAEIDALIAINKFIDTNLDNFVVNFLSSTGAQNPIYQYTHLSRSNDMIVSRRFYDSLAAKNDPRIPYYVTNITGGVYTTYDNGQQQATAFPGGGTPANLANRSRWGRYVVGNGTQLANGTITNGGAAPIRLITKSMVNFWLAEATLTLGTAGDAATYYQQAMTDQFRDIATFTSAPDSLLTKEMPLYITARMTEFNAAPATTAPGGKLNKLIREKWASSVGNGYEAYNDYRRTGFPVLAIAQNNQPGVPVIPYRLPYVQAELQGNAENVPLQTYPEGLLVKLWWMGN